MRLHEIIRNNEDDDKAILTELMAPYWKSLYTYYKEQCNEEPLLLVFSVTNNSAYAKIVPTSEAYDAIGAYYFDNPEDMDDELIFAQSTLLKDLI